MSEQPYYPHFDYEVAKEVGDRLAVFFKDLPKEGVQAAFEDLIDDYTCAVFGTTIMHEMRKLRLSSKGKSITIQTLARGRGVLVSSYGFKVKTDHDCSKCGKAFIVLDENSREDAEKERQSLG